MKHLQLSLLSSSWLNTLMLFWMLLLVHHAFQQSNSCFACVEQERIALLDIKSTFSCHESIIDPYSIFMSWNRSVDCCSWDGVYCSPTTKHVRRLKLYYSYDYTLNVSLFLPFRELRSLILSDNRFSSCIPSDCFGGLAKIDSLEYLDLSSNFFDSKALSSLAALGSLKALSLNNFLAETEFFINGSINVHKQSLIASELFINISGVFSKLSKLKYLDLSYNWLSGSIIPYLGGILSLKTLDLKRNNFGEGIDLKACQAWSKMSRLENLYLPDNSLDEKIIACLSKASSLKTLDLNENQIGGKFLLKACQTWSNMSRLENLYMPWNLLNEGIIPCLNKAPSLRTLDLSNNYIRAFQDWSNMSRLENLYLSRNSLTKRIILCLNKVSSLKTLDLSYNDMRGNFSLKEISKLNNLVELDISGNKFTRVSPLMLEWTSLKGLYMDRNEFDGTYLEGICKIKNLQELVIGYNPMKGNIPMCFAHLSSLQFFDISYNQFGPLFPSSIIKNLTMLKYASFSHNNFEDILSIDAFSNSTKLKVLDLSSNYQLEIQTEHLGMVPSFQLNTIDLSNCILNRPNGFIPTFLSNQYMMKDIDLSSADLKGNIPLWLFKNKTKLTNLNLRNNSLNRPLIFPSHKTNLLLFDVSNNKLTGEIPNNIGYAFPNIMILNMSYNFLQGAIHSSFGNLSYLTFLDFSNNNLSGQISNYIRYLNNLEIIDLSRNNFQGNLFPNNSSIPLQVYFADSNQFIGEVSNNLCISSLYALSIGENQLSDVFPNCISDLRTLEMFNARENNFEGNLPSELFNSSSLRYLDLSKNNFSGLIPSFVNVSNLEYLNLNGNRLTGTFPNALLGSHLIALDIGNNHFIGNIPSKMWTNLKNLKIISLKRNNFEGALSRDICKLQYLRMLDLSQNKLHGKIPSCLYYMGRNGSLWLEAEVRHGIGIYMNNDEEFLSHHINDDAVDISATNKIEYIEFSTKKRSDSYKGDILNYLSGLDLSENQFNGKIPKKIGEMIWLLALNLSNNQLTGPIPATLSKLIDIESLDLSHNMLIGRIPPQLVELYFLEFFSVAYNNLSGPTIGLVAQFGTFNESSYEGNPYLCGPPLKKNCTSIVPSPKHGRVTNDIHKRNEETMDRLILFASVTLGFICGFWGWMALLFFKRNLRYSFFLALDGYIEEALDMMKNLLPRMKSCW